MDRLDPWAAITMPIISPHIPVTEREAEIQPDGVADDRTRKSVVFVEIGRV